jgi:hypothetical protein
LGYAFRKFLENKKPLELNGAHMLLIYVDDVNLLGENINIIKNAEVLIHASKQYGLARSNG